MFRSIRATSATAIITVAVVAPLAPAHAQKSDLAVSPFVTFMPTGGGNPLAGLALTLAGDGGLAIRASGHLSLETSSPSTYALGSTMRPWGADADLLLSLGGRHTLAPFVFAGIGTAATDSDGFRIRENNWSYGAGASLPVRRAIDLFAESRWRMSQYVLPTADFAPRPSQEFRVGVSFHVGGAGPARSRSTSGMTQRSDATVSVPVIGFPSTGKPSASAARILETANRYVGVPYQYGGTSPSTGFDCSGFVQYVFAKQGVRLPRTSRQQAQVGTSLPPDWRAVSPGDLVMFAENGPISHVAIYAGRNRIIHSSASGGGVRYEDLSTQRGAWFLDHMVAARRVTPDARGLLLDLARGFAETGLQLDAPDRAPRPR